MMTYTKPNMFELGSASKLVLGVSGQYTEVGGNQAELSDPGLIICPADSTFPNEPLPFGDQCYE